MKTNNYNYHRNNYNGFSILELLIALSIAALLLTATAAAFDAAFDSYQANNDLATVSVSSRNSMYQMCSTIRAAWNDPKVGTITVDSQGNQLSLVDASGRDIIYLYDTNSRQLKVNVDSASQWYIMIDNVDPVAAGQPIFSILEPLDMSFPVGTVGVVKIRFKVTSGKVSQTLSASAIPRNIIYK